MAKKPKEDSRYVSDIDSIKGKKFDTSDLKRSKVIRRTSVERGSGQMITDTFESVNGIGNYASDTLEWVPAYFCEMSVLKSPRAKDFITSYTKDIYKKRKLRKDKYLGSEVHITRANLSEIRSGTLRAKMQDLIGVLEFECVLPNKHILFGRTQNCQGKIIFEKIPRVLYNLMGETTVKYVLVKEHEKALFVKDGRIMTILDAGKHDIINKSMEFDIIDIYFVDNGNISTRWGTSTTLTDGKGTIAQTQVKLRMNGDLIIRISDINNFFANLMKNSIEYYEVDLQTYVKNKVMQIINSEMSQTDPFNMYRDAEKVMLAVKVKANEFFKQAGIELVDLSIGSLRFDEEVEKIFKERLQKIKVEGALDDAGASREIERLKQLKELGIDVNTLVHQDHQIKMVQAGSPKVIPGNATVIGNDQSKVCSKCGQLAGKGKFCQNCGSPIIEEGKTCQKCGKPAGKGKFCQHCGAPLEELCPYCNQVAGSGKFCQHCGEPLEVTCPSCGKPAGEGNFCQNCGEKI